MAERPLGVILTAGAGTRLRPLTPQLPKPLIPLLNRPLLAYSLDLCAGLGLSDVVVIVGGDHHGVAEAAVELAPTGLSVTVAEQVRPRGPGDALASAGDALDGRSVVVIAVDTLIVGDVASQVEAFERSDALAGLLLHPTDRPREMGIAVLEGERVVHLEEKPQHPRSDLAVVGLWLLRPKAIERVRSNPVINAKGESDLTATIAAMVDEGEDVRGWHLDGEWLDAGSVEALLGAQSRLLADLSPTPIAAAGGEISGVVAGGEGASVTGSTLSGPVLLGAGSSVEDCALGSDVVVGDGAELRGVRLANSLVVPGARLEGVSYEGIVVTAAGEVAGPGAAS